MTEMTEMTENDHIARVKEYMDKKYVRNIHIAASLAYEIEHHCHCTMEPFQEVLILGVTKLTISIPVIYFFLLYFPGDKTLNDIWNQLKKKKFGIC